MKRFAYLAATVAFLAASSAQAAVDPVPDDNTRLVGDTGSFAGE